MTRCTVILKLGDEMRRGRGASDDAAAGSSELGSGRPGRKRGSCELLSTVGWIEGFILAQGWKARRARAGEQVDGAHHRASHDAVGGQP